MKKIAALTLATSLVLSSFGSAVLADTVITTTAPQSVITVPGEASTTTSTTENQTTTTTSTETTQTAETTASETTTDTTADTTTENTTTTETETPQATMWVTKLNIPADSPFYPVLRALEKLQLFFTRAEEQKAILSAELAAKRITEAQYLVSKAEIDATAAQVTADVEKLTAQTTKLMEEAQKRLEEAQKLVEQAEDEGQTDDEQESEKLIKVVNQHRIEVLSRVYLKVPATAKPSIMKNLVKFGATEEQLEKLTAALEQQVEQADEAIQQAEQANLTELKANAETAKMTIKARDTEKKDGEKLPPGQAKKLDEKQGKDKDNKGNNDRGSSKVSR